MIQLSPRIEFKRASVADTGTFEGWGSTFGNADLGGDIVERGAFAAGLAENAAEGRTVALLWAHSMAEPCGAWQEIREEAKGLFVRGQLAIDTPRGAQAHSLMKMGAVALSVGYIPQEFDFDRDGVRHLRKARLLEISVVAVPMNPKATITSTKSALDVAGIEELLRENFDVTGREAKKLASAAWAARESKQTQSQEIASTAARIRALTSTLTR